MQLITPSLYIYTFLNQTRCSYVSRNGYVAIGPTVFELFTRTKREEEEKQSENVHLYFVKFEEDF